MPRSRVSTIALLVAVLLALCVDTPTEAAPPPKTGFEERDGADWTTHAEELAFLQAVDRASPRASLSAIGTTEQGRPLHLLRIGHPTPLTLDRPAKPVALFVCTQHGNEPAPREGCLQIARTLALSRDPGIARLLTRWTVLIVPTANPDGRAANTRENSLGTDINRDHLNLESREAQAIAGAVRDWRPDVVVDLHEFGPGIPVLYDDDLLYLWPRNLNVDAQIHGLSKTLAIDYIGKGARREGYTSDEYGIYAAGDQDVTQTAGDGDEGILRNTMGLRHAIGILVESKVDMRLSPDEARSSAAVNRRRVASHRRAILETLRFLREQEETIVAATTSAPARKTNEGKRRSAPVYFGGADNDPPEAAQVADPPPCGYRLTPAQAKELARTFALHGIRTEPPQSGIYVPMAQEAEPVIPLLLDARGIRHAVAARAVERC